MSICFRLFSRSGKVGVKFGRDLLALAGRSDLNGGYSTKYQDEESELSYYVYQRMEGHEVTGIQ